MILVQIAVKFMRFINLFFKPLQLKEKVTIISRQSDKPTLDIALLYEELKQNNIETVVLTKTLKKTLAGVVSYCVQMIVQMYHIATSKVVVIDGYCILVSILPKKHGQKVIQMWHALGAIKKFGWQSIDNPDGHSKEVSEAMHMHKNYDYVFAPGTVTGKFFAEAFRTPEEKIVYYGLPRIDFIRIVDEKKYEEIKKDYPVIADKVNVLYVPTFRKNAELDLEKLVESFDFRKYNLIVKKHFLDKGDYSWAEKAGAIVDMKYSSVEWLRICEKVITDYSAMAFEAAILERDLYIYQPDVNAYEQNVGLNVDLNTEAIAEYVCNEEKQLFDKICQPYKKESIRAFRDKYMEVELNHCTKKICTFIAELLAE